MQVEGCDIGSGEGALGQISPEEFIDDAITDNSDLPFLFLLRWGRMDRHNDTNKRAVLGEVLVWTIVERAADSALRALELLIDRQVQARLDGSVIEETVVFAACNICEVGHIRDHRPRAILAEKRVAAFAPQESRGPSRTSG